MNKIIFVILIVFSIHTASSAQSNLPGAFPRVPGQDQVDSSEQEELKEEAPDTILIFHPYQLKSYSFYHDTTLYDAFHQYEAIRLQDIPYLNIGNNGSPHRPAMLLNAKRQGLDIGSHVLDLYKYRYEDLDLLESRRSITTFRFSQKNLKQEDLQLETRFSKTFQNGLHLNLMYRSIQYKGDYQQQSNKNRCGDFNLWYHSPKGNYDFVFNYLYNDLRQQDNGGIPKADSIIQSFSEFVSRPELVNGNAIDGRTRQQEKSFSLQNGFNIQWKGNKVGVTHRIATSNHLNDFFDAALVSDSSYYGKYYQKDTQQIYLKIKGITNEIYLDGVLDTITALRAGIKHEYYNIYQANTKSVLNVLSIIGTYHQTIAGRFQLSADGQWGVLENLGEYYIHGQIEADSKKLGAIEGHAIFQRSPVPLLFQDLYNKNKLLYSNHFSKPLVNQLGGSIFINSLKFKASIDQAILTNTIYLDALRAPAQNTSTISVTQLSADKSFDFGKMHSRHRIFIQLNSNNEVMRLPSWFTQNQIYYQDRWFKNNLFFQAGLDSRILPSFKTQAYFPLLGNFYNALNGPVITHPTIEFFFNFQMQNFRGFFKMEGLEYYIYKSGKTFFETYDQPLYRSNFRIGFTWTMRD